MLNASSVCRYVLIAGTAVYVRPRPTAVITTLTVQECGTNHAPEAHVTSLEENVSKCYSLIKLDY